MQRSCLRGTAGQHSGVTRINEKYKVNADFAETCILPEAWRESSKVSRLKRIVDEVSLASVIDELVVDGEAVVHVVILAVTLLVDVELGHPVVRLVRHNITTAQHSCTRFFLKPLLPRPGAVALLQVLVGRLLVEPAAAGHGVDMPGGTVAGEHDGVEPLGGEHAAVRGPDDSEENRASMGAPQED